MPLPKVSMAAALGVLAAAGFASEVQAQEVEIENTVARVVVIPEARTDIQVTVDQGAAGLPPIEVRQRGDDVRIDGGLRRRIQNCRSNGFVADPTQMPDGVSVTVRDHGVVNMAEAPLIIIRTPLDARVDASGAVWGAIGRSDSVELGAGGCGDWSIANTRGDLSIAIGGSGDVRAGTAQALEVAVGGSGDVRVASINGPADIAIGGSGEVQINGGRAPAFEVAIGGSGTVIFNGEVGNLEAAIAGSGDIRVARVTGQVQRTVVGSGDIHIGE